MRLATHLVSAALLLLLSGCVPLPVHRMSLERLRVVSREEMVQIYSDLHPAIDARLERSDFLEIALSVDESSVVQAIEAAVSYVEVRVGNGLAGGAIDLQCGARAIDNNMSAPGEPPISETTLSNLSGCKTGPHDRYLLSVFVPIAKPRGEFCCPGPNGTAEIYPAYDLRTKPSTISLQWRFSDMLPPIWASRWVVVSDDDVRTALAAGVARQK